MLQVKTLTILLLAVGLSAALTPAASADVFKTSSGGTATITGSQGVVNVFKTTAGSAECKKATYTGSFNSGSSELEVTPTYSECTCIGVACTIDTNGCRYRLLLGAATAGSFMVSCPAGKSITLTNTKCVIHISTQGNEFWMIYSNTGAGTTKEIGVSFQIVSTLAYTHTEGTGIGKCTSGSSTSGGLTGTMTLTGEQGITTEHLGIFIE